MYRTDSSAGGGLTRAEASALGGPQCAADRGRRAAMACKRAFDFLGAAALLFAWAPLFLILAIGVRLSSAGPVFYTQPRVGRGGRSFAFYKFRSMAVNSDAVLTSFLDSDPEAKERWEKYQKIEKDPRITRFGSFIRRTSLDELPQLFNVLKGDMSLVGPRPCMEHQRALYGRHWVQYCAVRPGLTGLWQVSGRNKLTYRERVVLDAVYVTNWSLLQDLKILLKTIKVVLTGDGSH